MKTLFLARHAKSSWKFPELADHDRPLNKRGQRDKVTMAHRLKVMGISVDSVHSSTAVRAADFAKVISNELSVPLFLDRDFYTFDSRALLSALVALPEEKTSLLVVGHNPAMTDVVNWLTGQAVENVPTSGVAKISFKLESWGGLYENCGQLDHLWKPKDISV